MKFSQRIKNAWRAFRYEGARPSDDRKRATHTDSANAEGYQQHAERIQLIWEARDLENNFPLVAGILSKLVLYTVGSLRYQARTSDPEVNQQIENYFNRWTTGADLAGRYNFHEIVQLALRSMLRDGDCGIVKTLTTEGVKLQLVEADRIGKPHDSITVDNYISGISIDLNTGRPVSFSIYKRTISGLYVDPVEIPAERFLFLSDNCRHDNYRGRSCFASAVATARDIVEILRAEKKAVKWAASQSGVVKTESGSADEWNAKTSTISGNIIEAIEPGTVQYLRTGEEISSFKSDRPSTTFTGFIETLQRYIADAIGIPYGFFVDVSKLGGVTARLDSQQANRVCKRLQSLLEAKLLNPIANAVIASGIESGEIDPVPDYMARKWQFPPWPTADIGRETSAAMLELQAGAATFSEYFAEKGDDWEEAFVQSANEQKRRAEIFASAGIEDPVKQSAQQNSQQFEESFSPPESVRAAARRALREREKKPASQRGMTAVGLARARDLANGRPVSEKTIRRMKAYFDRHAVDKKGSTWGDYGKGRQAWDGWGGDAGRAWANSIVERLNKQEEK